MGLALIADDGATPQPTPDSGIPKNQKDKEDREAPGKGNTPKPDGQEGKPGSGHNGEGESNQPDMPKKKNM